MRLGHTTVAKSSQTGEPCGSVAVFCGKNVEPCGSVALFHLGPEGRASLSVRRRRAFWKRRKTGRPKPPRCD